MPASAVKQSNKGTTFVVSEDRLDVEIVRADQPLCTVPLSDITEFIDNMMESGFVERRA